MSVEIVPIRLEHVEGFHAALDFVAREKQYLALTEAQSIDSTRAFVDRNITQNYPQLVAVDFGRVVGWCDIMPFERATQLHVGGLGMGLLPAARGRGIGTRLIHATLDRARVQGLTRVELGVYDDNARAVALYERVGFQREGVKRNATLIDGAYKNLIMMAIIDLDHWIAPAKQT